jgi:hypothetical protein
LDTLLEQYNQLLDYEDGEENKKRKAEHFDWAFDGFEAGILKKQKVVVAEDNMLDLLETKEEIALYGMRKRMQDTPLFQIPPSAEGPFSYFAQLCGINCFAFLQTLFALTTLFYFKSFTSSTSWVYDLGFIVIPSVNILHARLFLRLFDFLGKAQFLICL